MAHPVGTNARMLANKSVIDKSDKAITRERAVTRPNEMIPCENLITSWKLVDFFGLKLKIWKAKKKNTIKH